MMFKEILSIKQFNVVKKTVIIGSENAKVQSCLLLLDKKLQQMNLCLSGLRKTNLKKIIMVLFKNYENGGEE